MASALAGDHAHRPSARAITAAVPLTDEAAREAALVEAELPDAGTPVNLGDVLIAGVCRYHGGQLVTRDEHFERIADLETRSY